MNQEMAISESEEPIVVKIPGTL